MRRLGRTGIFAAAMALSWACAESNPAAERAAAGATLPWLEALDGGDYARCWNAAAPLFRESVARDKWPEKARGYREPLGAFASRRLNTTTYIVDPWGAPDGEYVIVVYDSRWAAGSIYESLHMQRQPDGRWLVAGYSVQQR